MVKLTCFDGVGCIGGNKILLEDGDAKLFFDFGRNFGAEGQFYEEFIQPKTLAGIYEPIQMGFLPPFRDLYRDDMVSELCDPWLGIGADNIGEVSGVLVSHAHVDHIGSLHHLRSDIPVYCSPMTAAVSRALQDTGASPSAAEYCYYVCRTEKEGCGLSTPDYRKFPYAGRKYCLTDDASLEFREFWDSTPDSRDLEALACDSAEICAGLAVKSFPVDHSVYGATAWAVETSAGWVVYAGDVRLHGSYGEYTRRFAEEAAKLQPVALILEGTRIQSESDHTEASVKDACIEVVRDCRDLVVADFGPRNVERLISFLEIARETGRELAILPKDAYLLATMGLAGGSQAVPAVDSPGIRIYNEYSGGSPKKWKSHTLDSYHRLCVSPEQVHANQDKFICCLSFWDVNELPYIRPVEGSVWISSNCEAFNEEMQIDEKRLRNWLDRFGMRFVGGDTGHNSPFHVSGHASGNDLMWLVRTIRPQTLIPVHTEHPQTYVDKVGDVCRVQVPARGVPIAL